MSWIDDGLPAESSHRGDVSTLPLLPQGYTWLEVTAHDSPEREWIIAEVPNDPLTRALKKARERVRRDPHHRQDAS